MLTFTRKTVFETAKNIVSQEGVRGLWRGTNATLIRNVPGIALYMTSLTQVRGLMATSPLFSNASRELSSSSHTSVLPTLTSQGNLVAGATARVAVGFLLNPFSVLKARYEVCLYICYVGTCLIGYLEQYVRIPINGLCAGYYGSFWSVRTAERILCFGATRRSVCRVVYTVL